VAITEPQAKKKYARKKWLTEPCLPEDGQEYEKYYYQTGETWKSISAGLSMPWRKLTPADLMNLNFGTAALAEVNWYVKNHNAGGADRTETDNVVRFDADSDPDPFVWAPRPVPNWNGAVRSRGERDVGHVAPDEKVGEHMNTLIIPPVYTIALELGDVDALFDSDPKGYPNEMGRAQRLQCLGYLYRPLGHEHLFDTPDPANPGSTIEGAYERVWKYYKERIHANKKPATRDLTDAEIDAILQRETRANLCGVPVGGVLPKKGEFLTPRLPRKREIGMIRVPGGYCTDLVYTGFPDDDSRADEYNWTFNKHSRHEMEERNVKDNPLIGKIPLVATVHKIDDDGERTPAAGVTVYFQLVKPDPWPNAPDDQHPANPKGVFPGFDAVAVQNAHRDAAQNMAKGSLDTAKAWRDSLVAAMIPAHAADPDAIAARARADAACVDAQARYNNPALTAAQIAEIANAVAAAPAAASAAVAEHDLRAPGMRDRELSFASPVVAAEPAIPAIDNTTTATFWDTYAGAVEAYRDRVIHHIDAVAAHIIDGVKNPWRMSGADVDEGGPWHFLKKVFEDNPPADADDPQKDNAPKDFGGKRGLDVSGGPDNDADGNPKPGVFEVGKVCHGLHTRRSDRHADYGDMTDGNVATKVAPAGEDHKYAVTAVTNDNGHACVVFTPSRCGGDRYKIRAYVGPPAYEFNGQDPKGPVVETGTLVVWRNLRLHRYVVYRGPAAQAGVSAAVTSMFKPAPPPPGGPPHATLQRHEIENFLTFQEGWARAWLDSPIAEYDLVTTDSFPEPARPVVKNIGPRNTPIEQVSVSEQYRRAYCEFIDDREMPIEVLDTNNALLQSALQAGIRTVERVMNTFNVDWSQLVFCDTSSPWLLNMRHLWDYNHAIGYRYNANDQLLTNWVPQNPAAPPARPALTPADLYPRIWSAGMRILQGMLHHLAGGNILPGLTIVQCRDGTTHQYMYSNQSVITTCGFGAVRSTFCFCPRAATDHPSYAYSHYAVLVHELGHVLGLLHQGPHPDDTYRDWHSHQAMTAAHVGHDPGQKPCVCVMSYEHCYGDHCGRCSLALRGWKYHYGGGNAGPAGSGAPQDRDVSGV
jgi:hypothetical protein